ncbi:hypothetical protein [Actinomadura rudentiformis]|uniref:LPXTG cell wall anchor domain-containing protein n=1 Tax=Actinomadura rudentiformis TaxID=359158 RepID=A0A6H9YU51_9ACTN|nr:hypothetical protein [Actinomadura rudentiformis]KAB2351814.1 hypothetical protein F8566_06295 [Actinomadura rudentiformis]
MIRRLSTACAAAAIGTALVAAPHVDDGVKVKPVRAGPGETVEISAPGSCVDPVATSNAFHGVRVPLEPANDRPLGRAGIGASTTPRVYPVKVSCSGGSTITGTVEVVPADTAAQESWGAVIAAGGTLVVVAGVGIAVWRARRRRTEPHV